MPRVPISFIMRGFPTEAPGPGRSDGPLRYEYPVYALPARF